MYANNQSDHMMQSASDTLQCPALPSHKYRHVMVLNTTHGLLFYGLSSCVYLLSNWQLDSLEQRPVVATYTLGAVAGPL